ncbi:MAG: hypothetical protein P8H62_01570 [Henriciella sp.]|nr:hypothetical protein [Henriciella sp.]
MQFRKTALHLAEEGKEVGFVNDVVPQAELMAAARNSQCSRGVFKALSGHH